MRGIERPENSRRGRTGGWWVAIIERATGSAAPPRSCSDRKLGDPPRQNSLLASPFGTARNDRDPPPNHRHNGRKVAQNLVRACLENGAGKGYHTAVTEATGAISQHIFRSKFGFQDRLEIPYKTFVFEGRRVFASIRGHTGTILMDKTLV